MNAAATRLRAAQPPRSLGSIPDSPQHPRLVCRPSSLFHWVVQALFSRVIRLLLEAGLLHPYNAGLRRSGAVLPPPPFACLFGVRRGTSAAECCDSWSAFCCVPYGGVVGLIFVKNVRWNRHCWNRLALFYTARVYTDGLNSHTVWKVSYNFAIRILWGLGCRDLCLPWTRVLGAFAHLREKRLLPSSCPSVRVAPCISVDPIWRLSVKFDVGALWWKCVEKLQIFSWAKIPSTC